MSGKRPLFVSAPRMILGIEDSSGKFNRLAYAIGMSLRVSVNVVPIQVCGSFTPVSYEPVQYMPVNATLQIIKLQKQSTRNARVKAAKDYYSSSGNDNFVDSNTIRNSVDTYSFSSDKVTNTSGSSTTTSDVIKLDPSNSIIEQAGIFKHLDALNILTSETFDIKIYLNISGSGDQLSLLENQSTLIKDNPSKISVINDLAPFMTVKDCRLTGRSVNIAQGQLLNEPINVMGLLELHSSEVFDNVIQEGSF